MKEIFGVLFPNRARYVGWHDDPVQGKLAIVREVRGSRITEWLVDPTYAVVKGYVVRGTRKCQVFYSSGRHDRGYGRTYIRTRVGRIYLDEVFYAKTKTVGTFEYNGTYGLTNNSGLAVRVWYDDHGDEWAAYALVY